MNDNSLFCREIDVNRSLESCYRVSDEVVYEDKVLKTNKKFTFENGKNTYDAKLIQILRHPKYDTKMYNSEWFQFLNSLIFQIRRYCVCIEIVIRKILMFA